uniref:protein disulfide-isomerase A4 isoform X2 n=1 Tax=Myxine glutinosa TaxID=7769 RepID=UPI00358ED6AB
MGRWSVVTVLVLVFVHVLCTRAEEVEDDMDKEEEEDEDDGTALLDENGVFVLTDENFDSFTGDKDIVLLEFYAPWCGHCKTFAPEYEQLAAMLAEDSPPIPVAKIDATAAPGLAKRFDVSGYPTLKILKKGKPVDYDGARTKDAIAERAREVAEPGWAPHPEATIVLTTNDFDSVVNEAEIILVEFYAPWCGHCKRLAPEYEKAAQELAKRSPPIPLAKVDATAESALVSRFQVSGYPTLKIFRKGRAYEYNGPRDKYGIVSHMVAQAGPASKQLHSARQLQTLLGQGTSVINVGAFSGEDSSGYKLYLDTANTLRDDFKLYHTFNTTVKTAMKLADDQVLSLLPERFYSTFEPKSYSMHIEDDTSEDQLRNFVVKHALSLVGQRTQDNEQKLYKDRHPLVVVFYGVDFSFDYRKATQFWRKKVLAVAKEFPEMTFAISDEEEYETELSQLGLSDSGEEVNVAIFDSGERKFIMEPVEFDSDALQDFVLAFKKGQLKPVIRSQPVPKTQKGPVHVVVGKTFERIVLDPSRHVLLELYAPWCGHCKKLQPVYEHLASQLSGRDDLIVAKMDATANDILHEAYKSEGFPTILLALRGRKDSPVKFEGENRDLESLSMFVEEHIGEVDSAKDEL